MLHVHANVKDSEETLWIEHVSKSIHEIARSEGIIFLMLVKKTEHVAYYVHT